MQTSYASEISVKSKGLFLSPTLIKYLSFSRTISLIFIYHSDQCLSITSVKKQIKENISNVIYYMIISWSIIAQLFFIAFE